MECMRRGSRFSFTTTLAWLPRQKLPVITFVQNGYTILEKRFVLGETDPVDVDYRNDPEEHIPLTDITVKITEEESFKFHKGYCNVQIRFFGGMDSYSYPTNIGFFEVKDSLSDEVLNEV